MRTAKTEKNNTKKQKIANLREKESFEDISKVKNPHTVSKVAKYSEISVIHPVSDDDLKVKKR